MCIIPHFSLPRSLFQKAIYHLQVCGNWNKATDYNTYSTESFKSRGHNYVNSQSTKCKKSKTASSRENHSSNKVKHPNAGYTVVHPVHRPASSKATWWTRAATVPRLSFLICKVEITPTLLKQSSEEQRVKLFCKLVNAMQVRFTFFKISIHKAPWESHLIKIQGSIHD